ALPAWSYTRGKTIAADAATEARLKAAAVALGASRAGKQLDPRTFAEQGADPDVARLRNWIPHPNLAPHLPAHDPPTHVFPNGNVARLVWGPILPWRFVGGAHDAPRGQMGPVDIEHDIWFRLDDHNRFVPVAVWQVGIGPE